MFVAKYGPDGSLLWAKSAGGGGHDDGFGIGIDGAGNSYVTGSFGASSVAATFGPGEPNQTVLNSAGFWDVFVAAFFRESRPRVPGHRLRIRRRLLASRQCDALLHRRGCRVGPGQPCGRHFTLTTTVESGDEHSNAFTEARQVCDNAGNCATAQVGGNMIDRRAPWVDITAPLAGETFRLGEVVVADYACQDSGSGIATCVGPVPDGSPIDTATVGAHPFEVTGTDNVAHVTTASADYGVSYGVCLRYDPTKVAQSGRTLAVKIQLCDAAGNNVSAPGVTVTATAVYLVSPETDGVLDDSGNANPDSNFRYDAIDEHYIFNLSLKGFTTGTWGLNFQATGDLTTHTIYFQVR